MEAERLNNTKEVAQYLGVSLKTIRRKVANKAIPHIYIGKHPRFDKKQIDRWIEKRTIAKA